MSLSHVIFIFGALLGMVASGGCSRRESDGQVVYTKEDGKRTSDIKKIDGTVSYQVVGKGAIPHEAEVLHQQARAKGEAGDYDSALRLLDQAASAAPQWAYPRYDMAYTYLLKGEPTKALEQYLEVDRLEPKGFFTTKTAVWCLQKEQNGDFPKGTYVAYVSLEWADGAKKREMVERMTAELPTFAPGWKEKAFLTQDDGDRNTYIAKALSLDCDPETRGILMLNKAAMLNKAGSREQATRLVEDLETNDSSTVSTKALAGELLKSFRSGAEHSAAPNAASPHR